MTLMGSNVLDAISQIQIQINLLIQNQRQENKIIQMRKILNQQLSEGAILL